VKALPLVLALSLQGCAGPTVPPSEEPCVAGNYFPLGHGAEWTYRVTGSLRSSHTMRVKAPLRIAPKPFSAEAPPERRAWILEGFLDDLAFACPTGNGADIFVQRLVGGAPKWAFVGFARYRWVNEEEWGFETQSGCIVNPVWTRRTGPERISTPAGTFECLKLTHPEGVYPTVWLAAGVGLVRREGRVDPSKPSSPSEVWELTSYSLPPSMSKDR
jgi:hypothetical protein